MNEEVENMVRRALEDEAENYRPSDWAHGAEGVRGQIVERRRRRRATGAVTLAMAGTAAAAVLGVVLTQAPRSAAAGASVGASAGAESPGAKASRSASPVAKGSAGAVALPTAITYPSIRIVKSGQTVVFEHQIWMRLTASQRCEGVGLPHSSDSCKSVTDGNQPQGTVSVQGEGSPSGQVFSPLYIGHGDVAAMTVTYQGVTYPVTVVKLAGHPDYATGYVWLPPTTVTSRLEQAQVRVYDRTGALLASLVPPTFPATPPSSSPSGPAH